MKSFIAKRVNSILVNLRYLRFKLLKYKENKKICNTFDHNFKNIPLYIMRKVSLERYYFVLYDGALTWRMSKMALNSFCDKTLHNIMLFIPSSSPIESRGKIHWCDILLVRWWMSILLRGAQESRGGGAGIQVFSCVTSIQCESIHRFVCVFFSFHIIIPLKLYSVEQCWWDRDRRCRNQDQAQKWKSHIDFVHSSRPRSRPRQGIVEIKTSLDSNTGVEWRKFLSRAIFRISRDDTGSIYSL